MVCGKCGYSYIVTGSTTNPHRQLGCRNRQIYGNEFKNAPNGDPIGCDNHIVDERILAKAMSVLLANVQVLRSELESEMLQEIQAIQNVRKEVDTSSLQAEI